VRVRFGAVVLLVALAAAAPAALAHQGNPNYLSQVDAISPATPGLKVEVLNRDDRLLLTNRSGRDVLVRDYEDAPYARVLADGTVEVNTDSKAYYVNNDRLGDVPVPKGVDGKGPPQWKRLDKTGRFEWHDHRMHWMGGDNRPPAVKDPSVRTKVFDWKVPVEVAGRPGAIAGTLFWTPLPGGGMPLAAVLLLAALVIAAAVFAVVVRRRRAATRGEPREPAEAW
jgi:hypothetical protein